MRTPSLVDVPACHPPGRLSRAPPDPSPSIDRPAPAVPPIAGRPDFGADRPERSVGKLGKMSPARGATMTLPRRASRLSCRRPKVRHGFDLRHSGIRTEARPAMTARRRTTWTFAGCSASRRRPAWRPSRGAAAASRRPRSARSRSRPGGDRAPLRHLAARRQAPGRRPADARRRWSKSLESQARGHAEAARRRRGAGLGRRRRGPPQRLPASSRGRPPARRPIAAASQILDEVRRRAGPVGLARDPRPGPRPDRLGPDRPRARRPRRRPSTPLGKLWNWYPGRTDDPGRGADARRVEGLGSTRRSSASSPTATRRSASRRSPASASLPIDAPRRARRSPTSTTRRAATSATRCSPRSPRRPTS